MHRTKILVPPKKLLKKVGNTSDTQEYLQVGSRTASTIANVLSQNGYSLGSFSSILDFACGCGRTLNFISQYVSEGVLFGSDYDPELVNWCNRHLPIQASRNADLPPTDYAEGQFDFIYAISFFTHLPRDLQLRWLDEFLRLLRSGGLLLLTTHGEGLAAREGVDIPADGFFYKVGGRRFNQQVAFQSRAFVEREWSEVLVLDYCELGLMGHQDVILLGTKADSKSQRCAVPAEPVPAELLRVYENRPDLKEHFNANGLGRPESSWNNLSLMDWALSNGGNEVRELRHLAFEAIYETIET